MGLHTPFLIWHYSYKHHHYGLCNLGRNQKDFQRSRCLSSYSGILLVIFLCQESGKEWLPFFISWHTFGNISAPRKPVTWRPTLSMSATCILSSEVHQLKTFSSKEWFILLKIFLCQDSQPPGLETNPVNVWYLHYTCTYHLKGKYYHILSDVQYL